MPLPMQKPEPRESITVIGYFNPLRYIVRVFGSTSIAVTPCNPLLRPESLKVLPSITTLRRLPLRLPDRPLV